jgi:NAD(P)-dependent dehydrogenase (short-subunit alcohol dehydrogenase family)
LNVDGGPVVLVTGANRGLGAEIARQLGRAGATVVLTSRRAGDCDAVARELAAAGARATVERCDVASIDDARDAVAATVRTHGRLDAIVNNAGVVEPIGRLGDTDPAAWAAAVQINLTGPYHLIHAALPTFVAQKRGVVVNVSTGAADRPREGWSMYCSTKAGLVMLTRAVDLEYRDAGVLCYGFRPGMTDTGMQDVIRASGMNEVSRVPKEKLLPPARPARIAAWLAMVAPPELAGTECSVQDAALEARAQAWAEGR